MPWFDKPTIEAVRRCFEEHLPPNWVFSVLDESSGDIRWKRTLANGFALELVVHPVYKLGSKFNFQSKLFLIHSLFPALKHDSHVACCLRGAAVERDKPVILVSVYLEGLRRVVEGGEILPVAWSDASGLSDSSLWFSNVSRGVALFNLNDSDADFEVETMFALDSVNEKGFPPSVTLFYNVFILAAYCAAIKGDLLTAEKYILSGRGLRWSQGIRKISSDRFVGIERSAACLEIYIGE